MVERLIIIRVSLDNAVMNLRSEARELKEARQFTKRGKVLAWVGILNTIRKGIQRMIDSTPAGASPSEPEVAEPILDDRLD